MRFFLTVVGFANVLAMMLACAGGKKEPQNEQQPVPPAAFGKVDPLQKSKFGEVSKNGEAKGGVDESTPVSGHRDAHDQPVRLGDTQVRIRHMQIKKVVLETLRGVSESESEKLLIVVQLVNVNPTRKVSYKSWSDEKSRDGLAKLHDNFGNAYNRTSSRPETFENKACLNDK